MVPQNFADMDSKSLHEFVGEGDLQLGMDKLRVRLEPNLKVTTLDGELDQA